jgi:hypothetical protein
VPLIPVGIIEHSKFLSVREPVSRLPLRTDVGE